MLMIQFRKIYFLVFILYGLLLLSIDTIAQQDTTAVVDRTMIKKAKENIRVGHYFFQDAKYNLALSKYIEAYKIIQDDAQLNYNMGVCFLETFPKYRSLGFFMKAYEFKPKVSDAIHYMLGRGFQLNYMFDRAIVEYETFRRNLGENELELWNPLISKRFLEISYAREFLSRSTGIFGINNAGGVLNSKYPEYRPFITANEEVLMFTSRRASTTGGAADPSDYKYYEDIYVSNAFGNGWTTPKSIGSALNTLNHDAIVGLSADGNRLVYFAGSKNGGDISICIRKDEKWGSPEDLPKSINTAFNESSATINNNGDTLYFVSNRKDGSIGGKDIFVSYKAASGVWSQAKNLSPNVNTEYDEDGVFLKNGGKVLYFSSKGHNSMGGYDIFKTSLLPNGEWSTPENLGFPVNSTEDDVFFAISADGRNGYYSTAREDGYGDQDIYRIVFYETETPPIREYIDSIMSNPDLTAEVLDTGIVTVASVLENAVLAAKQPDTLGAVARNRAMADSIALVNQLLAQAKAKTISDSLKLLAAATASDLAAALRAKAILDSLELANRPKPTEPTEVTLELIDLSDDDKIKSYIPTGEEPIFNFTLPPEIEYEVQVEIEELSVKRGRAQLLSSRSAEELLRSELTGDSTMLLGGDADMKRGRTAKASSVKASKSAGAKSANLQSIVQRPIEETDDRNNKTYTIQIKAMRNPVDAKLYFKNLGNVQVYYCTDGLYRYTIGDILGWNKAVEERNHIAAFGYKDAFVVEILQLEKKVVSKN